MPAFDYYYGGESNQFSFCRIPHQLITGQDFKGLSNDAKLLYALMLERMGLSARNSWYDEQGCVFIYLMSLSWYVKKLTKGTAGFKKSKRR